MFEDLEVIHLIRIGIGMMVIVSVALRLIRVSKLKKGDLLVQKAIKLVEKEKFSNALPILQQAISSDLSVFGLDVVYGMISNCYLNLDLYEKAIMAVEEGLKNNPNDAVLYANAGYIYREWNKKELSEEFYRKAIEIDPTEEECYIGLGALYLSMNKPNKAIKVFLQVVKNNKTSIKALEHLSLAYANIGDREKTVKYMKLAKKLGCKDLKYIEVTLEASEEMNAELTKSGMDIIKLSEKIEDLEDGTTVKFLRLTMNGSSNNDTESKFGGRPYMPINFTYPRNCEGKPLLFLAQINFNHMPALDNFPKSGLLQFYISEDDSYGCDFEHPTNNDNFKVVYHNTVADNSFINQNYSTITEQGMKIEFKYAKESVGNTDYRFKDMIREYIGIEFDELPDSISDVLSDNSFTCGHKIGGYGDFTQWDPREEYADYKEYAYQLLQLDSSNEFMWGDSGIAHFLITENDLKNLNFDKVLYTWDCC